MEPILFWIFRGKKLRQNQFCSNFNQMSRCVGARRKKPLKTFHTVSSIWSDRPYLKTKSCYKTSGLYVHLVTEKCKKHDFLWQLRHFWFRTGTNISSLEIGIKWKINSGSTFNIRYVGTLEAPVKSYSMNKIVIKIIKILFTLRKIT